MGCFLVQRCSRSNIGSFLGHFCFSSQPNNINFDDLICRQIFISFFWKWKIHQLYFRWRSLWADIRSVYISSIKINFSVSGEKTEFSCEVFWFWSTILFLFFVSSRIGSKNYKILVLFNNIFILEHNCVLCIWLDFIDTIRFSVLSMKCSVTKVSEEQC